MAGRELTKAIEPYRSRNAYVVAVGGRIVTVAFASKLLSTDGLRCLIRKREKKRVKMRRKAKNDAVDLATAGSLDRKSRWSPKLHLDQPPHFRKPRSRS